MSSLISDGIDWSSRQNAYDFKARLALAYLGKELHADMSFFVEWDKVSVPAHSLIVAAASPVLECCIFGTGHIQNTSRVVTIRGCALADFHIVLEYIYTGTIKEMTHRSAVKLLPLAHFYELIDFEETCLRQLKCNLSVDTVCQTYGLIYYLDSYLLDTCMSIMQTHTSQLLRNGSLMQMQDNALRHFLSQDRLNIRSEFELFMGMLEWAKQKCSEFQMMVNPTNLRHVLRDRLDVIRFAAMDSKEYSNCLAVVGPNFFTADEISTNTLRIAMGSSYNCESNHIIHFGSVPRLPFIVEKECRLKFSKFEVRSAMALHKLRKGGSHILTIFSKFNKDAYIHIQGLLAKTSSFTVMVLPKNAGDVPVDCVRLSDKIIFSTPIPIDKTGILKLLISPLRRDFGGVPEKRMVVMDRRSQSEICVKDGTWTNVTSVLYTIPVNSVSAGEGGPNVLM